MFGSPNPLSPGPGRFLAGVFGFTFFGVGLTLIGFLWLSPFGQWDSPPIFFRIVGSLIAIPFVAIGGTTALGAIRGGNFLVPRLPADLLMATMARITPKSVSYVCPHCAAPLQGKVDVSPSGDAKCPFCNSWFNVNSTSSARSSNV